MYAAAAPARPPLAAAVRDRLRLAPAAPAPKGFFAHTPLDALVPRGVAQSLHVFAPETTLLTAPVAGFVLSLLRRLPGTRPVLWVEQDLPALEGGRLYAPGLQAFGVDPGRLLPVAARSAADALWAAEEGLASRALAAVVAEVAAPALDLTATRRLALRSDRAKIPVWLIASGPEAGATAARTRWQVAAAPSGCGPHPGLLGAPAWRLDLLKNRDGPTGTVLVAWDPVAARYGPASKPAARPVPPAPRTAVPRPAASAAPAVARLHADRRRAAEPDR